MTVFLSAGLDIGIASNGLGQAGGLQHSDFTALHVLRWICTALALLDVSLQRFMEHRGLVDFGIG